MASLEIESSDVIRLILQFLKENNLQRSLHSLQEESRVALGAVDSIEEYTSEIQNGRWDAVLQKGGCISYPEEVLHLLYEQVFCELIEAKEVETARQLLKDTAALQSLKLIHPDRYRRLEQFASRGIVDSKELYEGSTRDKKRTYLSTALTRDVRQAPPSRLLALLGMALKWHHHLGLLPASAKFDLFRGMVATRKDQQEECVKTLSRSLSFGVESHIQCATFSPNGQLLVTGSVDGILEVLDALTGTLRSDLDYQANESMMVHEKAVMSVEISKDSEILASGSQDGELKLWRLQTGACVRKFQRAHEAGITSIQFSKDSASLLTASLDHTAKIHGLKSGKCLAVFAGHGSYVNSAVYTCDNSKVVTGSSDGTVRIWDTKSCECVLSMSPPPPVYLGDLASDVSVNSVFASSKDKSTDLFFVCTKSNVLHLLNLSGQVIKSFSSGKREKGDFVAATASPMSSNWLYCGGEDQTIYCFSNETGKLENVIMQAHKADIFGIAHHPQQNLLVSWGFDGALNFYQP